MILVIVVSGGSTSAMAMLNGGYDGLNTYSFRGLVSLACTGMLVPATLIAARLVGGRPISSYLHSRESWNWKLFIYPLIITVLVLIIPSIYLISHIS